MHRTSVNQTHRDVKLLNIKFTTIILIGKTPEDPNLVRIPKPEEA